MEQVIAAQQEYEDDIDRLIERNASDVDLKQASERLEAFDEEYDEIYRRKNKFLKESQKFAKSRFGKDLIRIVPLPGPTDFGVAVVLFVDTTKEYGVAAGIGDLVTSAMPDLAQVGGLVLGGGVVGSAFAMTVIDDAMRQSQAWIDKYNEIMQGTDPMRKRIRTRHGTAGALAELQEAKLQAQLAPSIAIHGEDVKGYRDRAKHVQQLDYLIGFVSEAKEFDDWQKFKAGDLNWDGAVDETDEDIFIRNYGRTDLKQYNSSQSPFVNSGDFGDIDLDGDVDFDDLLEFAAHF